jgi:hypothetical protein
MVSQNGVSEDGSARKDSLLVVKIAENGEIRLLCRRATSMARRVWRQVGPSAEPSMQRVILPGLVLGLVHGALRLAADLAERYAGYDGPWGIGLRLTDIRDAIAYEYVQSGDEDVVQPYDANNYQKTMSAHTSDLRATPAPRPKPSPNSSSEPCYAGSVSTSSTCRT